MSGEWELKPGFIPPPEGPVLVVVLDGFGENLLDQFNAIHMAKTPCYDKLKAAAPDRWRTVKAHGLAVGLPSDADMGNSEVGHNALGAGMVYDQGASLVDKALAKGALFEGDGWKYISDSFKSNTVHWIGLMSNGGVHSRMDQLYGMMTGAAKAGAKKQRVHVLSDGRDVPDGSSLTDVQDLEEFLSKLNEEYNCDARIASGGGRMCVTMDRYEADWSIVERGWKAHVLGQAPHTFTDAHTAFKTLKGSGDDVVSDQWLDPFVIVDGGKPVGTVEDGDAVALFNFRADRMVEISKAFEYADFNAFDRERFPKTRFVGLMQYDGDLKLPARFLVTPPAIGRTAGEFLAKNKLSSFVCAETQKFGHVTFFWNGNRSGYFDEALETYVEIPSDKLPFNQAPKMKAVEVGQAGKEAILSGRYKHVRLNFANPDMVGHTGDLEASTIAVETVDAVLQELLDAIDEAKGRFLVTADHGNCDDMVQRHKKTNEPLLEENGKPKPLTSHTLAPVPVCIGGAGLPAGTKFRKDLPNAGLANVTATYVNLLGYEAPSHMAPSLIHSDE